MEIIVCGVCKGEGRTEHWEVGHNPDRYYEKCFNCNGTGRQLTRSFTITTPFGTDLNKGYLDADSKICELIRNTEKNARTLDTEK